MTSVEIRQAMTDPVALIATLYGEARAEPIEGLIAVGCVIRNRVLADLGGDGKPDWWGETFTGVCLKRGQFSCWWEDNANTRAVYRVAQALLLREPIGEQGLLAELRWIATGLIEQQIRDTTTGSDHYLTAWLFQSDKCPSWAKGRSPVARIGHHVFLRLSQ